MDERLIKLIEREYAHFHRVLSSVLRELAQEPGTVWLGHEGHHFAEAYQDNVYRKAVVPLLDTSAYDERLAELARVQGEALARLGVAKVPNGLLLPQVLDEVSYARLRRKRNYRVLRLSKPEILGRYGGKLGNALAALQAFRAQAFSLADEGVLRLEEEVATLEAGLARMAECGDDELREHYWFERVPVSVYRQGRPMKQYHVRDVGLVLVGPQVKLGWNDGVRNQRSDTTQLEPLLRYGPLEVYSSSAWDEAYEAARQ